MASKTEQNTAPAETDEASPGSQTIVLDLGKKKRKQVRRLRKGRGRLMDKVQRTIDEMKEDGMLSADADTVVIVVKAKRKKGKFMW